MTEPIPEQPESEILPDEECEVHTPMRSSALSVCAFGRGLNAVNRSLSSKEREMPVIP